MGGIAKNMTISNGKIRAAWIGCGSHSYNLMFDSLRNLPVYITAICDTNEDRLRIFSERYNIQKTYNDYIELLRNESVDAVFCVANAQLHYEVARDAMDFGANVFVEKTPCINNIQAKELCDIQKKTGRFTMAGFNRRYTTAYAMAKEITKRKEFGGVMMYLAKYQASAYSSEKHFVFNHIVHHLDLARFFLGEIKDLHIYRIRINNTQVGYNISFEAESGCIGVIQSGSLQNMSYPLERVEITGTGTNVIVDNIKKLEYNRPGTSKDRFENAKLMDGNDALVWKINHGDLPNNDYYGFFDELRYFTECVSSNKRPVYDMEDTVKTMELLERVLQKSEVWG